MLLLVIPLELAHSFEIKLTLEGWWTVNGSEQLPPPAATRNFTFAENLTLRELRVEAPAATALQEWRAGRTC